MILEGTAEPKILVGVEDAAKRLSVGRSLVKQLITSGELRSIKLGRRRLVAVTDVAAFVERLREGEDSR